MLSTILMRPNNPSAYRWFTPWLVTFSAALFFFYEFIQMNMFNSMSTELMQAFDIDATHLGTLSSAYFGAAALFLLPAGVILDRFSNRTVILMGLISCILGTLIFAYSTSYFVALACRFITGIGNAFCFLTCVRLSSRWFQPKQMALAMGLVVTIGMLGGWVAQAPLNYLIHWLGWRESLYAIAGLGVIILLLTWWFVFDYPPQNAEQFAQAQADLNQLGLIGSLKLAFKNPQNWLCGLYTSLMNLALMLLGGLWGSIYLIQIHHIPRQQATLIISMLFVGTMIGSPVVGQFSDYLRRRKIPMLLGSLFSLLTILTIMFIPVTSEGVFYFLFFALGFFSSSQVISYPTIAESNSTIITGTAASISSWLIMSGPTIAQPIFGWLMDLNWDQTLIDGVRIYSASDYILAMSLFPIAFIVSFVLALLVKETYCQRIVD